MGGDSAGNSGGPRVCASETVYEAPEVCLGEGSLIKEMLCVCWKSIVIAAESQLEVVTLLVCFSINQK